MCNSIKVRYTISEKLWRYPGEAAWYFLRLSLATSQAIDRVARKGGWGSVKVRVTVGVTSWETSLFPEKEGGYMLPVKAKVRKQEKLEENKVVTATIELI